MTQDEFKAIKPGDRLCYDAPLEDRVNGTAIEVGERRVRIRWDDGPESDEEPASAKFLHRVDGHPATYYAVLYTENGATIARGLISERLRTPERPCERHVDRYITWAESSISEAIAVAIAEEIRWAWLGMTDRDRMHLLRKS